MDWVGGRLAAQQRFDDALHPRLLQLVHQLIQVRVAPQYQPLACGVNRVDADLPAAVADSRPLEADFVGQCVDQPGLALCLLPDLGHGVPGKPLARLLRVLVKQIPDLEFAEVAQPQGLRLDVEGASAQDGIPFGRRMNAVVAHVAYAAQHYTLGKPLRPVGVSGAELPQHRHECVADQRVDLVDQQHQWPGVGCGPARKHAVKRDLRSLARQDIWPRIVHRAIVQSMDCLV